MLLSLLLIYWKRSKTMWHLRNLHKSFLLIRMLTNREIYARIICDRYSTHKLSKKTFTQHTVNSLNYRFIIILDRLSWRGERRVACTRRLHIVLTVSLGVSANMSLFRQLSPWCYDWIQDTQNLLYEASLPNIKCIVSRVVENCERLKNDVFWDMTPCDSRKNQRLGGSYLLHH
jgi:hypothetical protein